MTLLKSSEVKNRVKSLIQLVSQWGWVMFMAQRVSVAAGSITFAPPDCFMSVTCALWEPPFNCEENRAPVLVLPVVRCSLANISQLWAHFPLKEDGPSCHHHWRSFCTALSVLPAKWRGLFLKKLGFFSQCCQVVVHKGLCDCWTMYYCRLISNTKHFLVVPLSNFDSPTCWWTSQLPPVYLHAKLCTEQTPANPKKWIIKWIPPVCGLASNETWIKWFQQTGG